MLPDVYLCLAMDIHGENEVTEKPAINLVTDAEHKHTPYTTSLCLMDG